VIGVLIVYYNVERNIAHIIMQHIAFMTMSSKLKLLKVSIMKVIPNKKRIKSQIFTALILLPLINACPVFLEKKKSLINRDILSILYFFSPLTYFPSKELRVKMNF